MREKEEMMVIEESKDREMSDERNNRDNMSKKGAGE